MAEKKTTFNRILYPKRMYCKDDFVRPDIFNGVTELGEAPEAIRTVRLLFFLFVLPCVLTIKTPISEYVKKKLSSAAVGRNRRFCGRKDVSGLRVLLRGRARRLRREQKKVIECRGPSRPKPSEQAVEGHAPSLPKAMWCGDALQGHLEEQSLGQSFFFLSLVQCFMHFLTLKAV